MKEAPNFATMTSTHSALAQVRRDTPNSKNV